MMNTSDGMKRWLVGHQIPTSHIVPGFVTFQDFLLIHLQHVLGEGWLRDEMQKPRGMHFIAMLFVEFGLWVQDARANPESPEHLIANGYARELMQLAYDVYVLKHSDNWNGEFARRLRLKGEYQGVRHEIAAAAMFARLGFRLDHLAGTTEKHPEFIARHPTTYEAIAVEAKSRHRPGVIHHQGVFDFVRSSRGDVDGLVNKAMTQAPGSMPFIVMVDLNAIPPKGSDQEGAEYFRDVAKLLRTGAVEDPSGIMSGIVFLNFSHHYAKRGNPVASGSEMYTTKHAKWPLSPGARAAIGFALHDYSNIPT